MTDYSRKRCVVCNRTGGITLQPEGIYECRNCGTPYRPRAPRAAKTKVETTTDTQLQEAPVMDRFVWFTYTDPDGVSRSGLYDCPVTAEAERPTLTFDENRLQFMRHLHKHGKLSSHTTEE
jgi:hypothetical protein